MTNILRDSLINNIDITFDLNHFLTLHLLNLRFMISEKASNNESSEGNGEELNDKISEIEFLKDI